MIKNNLGRQTIFELSPARRNGNWELEEERLARRGRHGPQFVPTWGPTWLPTRLPRLMRPPPSLTFYLCDYKTLPKSLNFLNVTLRCFCRTSECQKLFGRVALENANLTTMSVGLWNHCQNTFDFLDTTSGFLRWTPNGQTSLCGMVLETYKTQQRFCCKDKPTV